MTDYTPPLQDMLFVLGHVVGLDKLPEHPDLGAWDLDNVASLLEPAAKLSSEVLAPLNRVGDQEGCMLQDHAVQTPTGFQEAYQQYQEAGWNAVPFSQDFGGQGLPWLIAFALQEMWQGANMSFGLCPLLNQGAIDLIEEYGSAEQKDTYLEKLISGEWTGTMNLTEPQAGTDLSAIRSKAERNEDGTYKIFGQKIFITYGEHDFTENIVHLVLARLPDAPEGVKGISLFIVPKILDDGSRNDAKCTGLEHKLGIHASPTCTMQFGDEGGATGYLVGAENEGIKYMFRMMNNARLSVGLQGVAISEASLQRARVYAEERVQGTALDNKKESAAIIQHPDVQRMLLAMRAMTEAGRALTYEAALALDLARGGCAHSQAKVDLLTPIVKAWCTDNAVDVTSLGVQIHGGMGFIEETGAAQLMRDSRILPIYEGTNGIQANDLVFRKVLRDEGKVALAYCCEMQKDLGDTESVSLLEQATQWIVKAAQKDLNAAAMQAVPYLNGFALIAGAAMLQRSSQKAQDLLDSGDSSIDKVFLEQKIQTAQFYQRAFLPFAKAHLSFL